MSKIVWPSPDRGANAAPQPAVPRHHSGHKPNRRRLLAGVGVAAAGLLSACGATDDQGASAPAVAKRKRRLTMVTTWPKNFPGMGTSAERFARRVSEMSDGALTIKVFAAGELIGALGVFDAVAEGKADMYHGAEYYFQGKSPAFSFFAAVPMGMTASEMASWIRFGGGQELWDQLSGKFGVKAMMCGNTGVQMGGWYNKEINSVEDFRGLRVRMPGLGGEVLTRLGANTVTKQGSELFQALAQGNIDATEWIGPWNDLAFGFHTVVKNYYYPGFHEPGTTISLGLNKELWDDMSPSERAIIQAAADAENDVARAEHQSNNGVALQTLINDHGVKLQKFNDAIMKEVATVSAQVLADAATADALSAQVYESFMAARQRHIEWGEISEQAFAAARQLASA